MSTKLHIGRINAACLVMFAVSSFAQSLDDYRTITSGNWTDPTIWQRYDGTNWVAAISSPTAAIANVITVRSPHTVTANNITIDQTIVEAGATVDQIGNVVLNNGSGDDLQINGTWNLNSSSAKLYGANATVTVNGIFYHYSGTMGDYNTPLLFVNITPTGTLYLTSSGDKVIERAQLINNGTIHWYNGSLHTNQTVNTDTCKFINNGTWNIMTPIPLNTYGNNNTFIINSIGGTINKGVIGHIITQQGTYFINEGTINVYDGAFSTNNQNASFHNYGNINVMLPGEFDAAWNVNMYNGSTVTGDGNFNVTGTVKAVSGNVIYGNDLKVNLLLNGYLTGAGLHSVNGTMNWTLGQVGAPGYIHNGLSRVVIGTNGTLNINGSGNKIIERAQLTNNGTINWNGGSIYTNQTVNNDTCKLINNGTWNINNGAADLWGQANTYYVNGAGGTIIKNSTGTNTIQYNAAFVNEGLVKGIGTLVIDQQAGYQNSGTYNPGLSPGKLNVHDKNPLTPQGNLLIELQDASGAGIGHDLLEINGSITLSGKLTVVEIGSVPTGTYTIINLTSGTVSGNFDVVDLPPHYVVGTTASTVYITKAQVYFSTVNETICDGDSYYFNGEYLTAGGTYKDTLTAFDNNDSIVTLILNVETIDVSVVEFENTLIAAQGYQYQWIDCNTNLPINNETGQAFVPTQSGNYAVIVYGTHCTDTSACTNVTIVGIEEILQQQEWKIYPNPSSGEFNILSAQSGEFELYDVTGKLINQFHVKVNEPFTYYYSLPQGVYVVKGKERGVMRKIVVH